MLVLVVSLSFFTEWKSSSLLHSWSIRIWYGFWCVVHCELWTPICLCIHCRIWSKAHFSTILRIKYYTLLPCVGRMTHHSPHRCGSITLSNNKIVDTLDLLRTALSSSDTKVAKLKSLIVYVGGRYKIMKISIWLQNKLEQLLSKPLYNPACDYYNKQSKIVISPASHRQPVCVLRNTKQNLSKLTSLSRALLFLFIMSSVLLLFFPLVYRYSKFILCFGLCGTWIKCSHIYGMDRES